MCRDVKCHNPRLSGQRQRLSAVCDAGASASDGQSEKYPNTPPSFFVLACESSLRRMDLATTHDWREGAIVPEAESCADHAAFQAFVERNMRFAFRVAWALLRNRSDADDVVQECFLRLYRKRVWQGIPGLADGIPGLAEEIIRRACVSGASRLAHGTRPAAAPNKRGGWHGNGHHHSDRSFA
jgi:hypothetical protein